MFKNPVKISYDYLVTMLDKTPTTPDEYFINDITMKINLMGEGVSFYIT